MEHEAAVHRRLALALSLSLSLSLALALTLALTLAKTSPDRSLVPNAGLGLRLTSGWARPPPTTPTVALPLTREPYS